MLQSFASSGARLQRAPTQRLRPWRVQFRASTSPRRGRSSRLPARRSTFNGEPPTLLIENAGTSGARTIWLQLEVGTDAGFQQIVHQADQIALGGNGRTSYRLPAPLGAGYTYYWRTRAADGANTGPYSAVSSFSVVPPVVVDAPVAIAPSGKINTNKPEFKVTNGAISGTTRRRLSLRGFDGRRTSARPDRASSRCRSTAAASTTMTIGELPYKTTYYWRVRGSDGTMESTYSNTLHVHHARSAGARRRRRRRRRCPGRRADGTWRHDAGTAAVRCRATARASCRPWRARIRARCQNSCQEHGG